jgi:hypothetical protein
MRTGETVWRVGRNPLCEADEPELICEVVQGRQKSCIEADIVANGKQPKPHLCRLIRLMEI